MIRNPGFNEEFAFIESVNRKRLKFSDSVNEPIDLATGVQKLHVSACQDAVSLVNALILWDATAWHCAEAILRLDVIPGVIYELKAKVNRDKDFADIWIEIAETSETVVGPMRVTGIKKRF
jgi:hypothetical protein